MYQNSANTLAATGLGVGLGGVLYAGVGAVTLGLAALAAVLIVRKMTKRRS